LPRAGDRNTTWVASLGHGWMAMDPIAAYQMTRTTSKASISSCLYLLVKYAEVTPKSFVCTSDPGITEWKIADEVVAPPGMELIDAWDFGRRPSRHVSYAYHYPFQGYALTMSSEPALAVAADRNPWMDSPVVKARDFSKFKPYVAPYNGTVEQDRAGNSPTHKGDGQNVLFLDSHVEFDKSACCGLDEDNIYTSWDGGDRARGKPATFGSQPADPNDSLLVNDPPVPPQQ
jgi:hypothetical protein